MFMVHFENMSENSFVVRHGTKWSAVLTHLNVTPLRFVADYEHFIAFFRHALIKPSEKGGRRWGFGGGGFAAAPKPP